MERERAIAFLSRAPFVHIASATPDGEPVLRVVHAVVIGDKLLFHGAPAGEKMDIIGRRAVVSYEEVVASIPSYFVDPERACPATTFYESVQAHGVIERVEDPVLKAEMLSALMGKHQPEGGHVPIDARHDLYRKPVAGILVLALSLADVDGKAKLGQNRTPEEVSRIAELLWKRGEKGDALAVDLVLRANPSAPLPAFLRAPEGVSLICAMAEEDADDAAALLEGAYWTVGLSAPQKRNAFLGSTAWVGARDLEGKLIATARAISDGSRNAWIYDVIVAPAWRGRGVGRALMRLLLDHPAVRNAAQVLLNTVDAEKLYESFGFRVRSYRDAPNHRVVEMILVRPQDTHDRALRVAPLASR